MTRISFDVPVPSLEGEWTPAAAADAVGKHLQLTVGDERTTALIVDAQAAPDGLSIRLDLEVEADISDAYTIRIDVDGE